MKEKWKGFLIALAVGAVFVLGAVFLNRDTGKEPLRIACDAFTLAAVLLLGFAGLVWSRNEGTFDMVSYGVTRSFKYRYRKMDKAYKESFYDYRKRTHEERKPATGCLWAGLVYLAVALVLMLIFYVC